MAKSKFYVVWNGHNPGVYTDWNSCKAQIAGYPDAKYKSFEDEELANVAYKRGYEGYVGQSGKVRKLGELRSLADIGGNASKPELESLAVDAACSGNPGRVEYRGVYTRNGNEIFRIGPFECGTNNIGEFLALVHGLALLKQKNSNVPLYSDSVNAISWVRQKKCKTKLERNSRNAQLFVLIERAEKWLAENSYTTQILKWDTKNWGEIPADFGRK